MADIFISYSSYDREKAAALVKELRARGYDVWMDEGGIGGAQDWSSEIVEAINRAKTVLFLISKDSVTSHNCAKEIHLANEKHKNILPVVLEETPLPVLFEYPLAGLQRVSYERTDAILQALEVLKSGKTVLEAMLSQSKIGDGIVRLAVLPFEDQSPAQDNQWLASGMMNDLIDTLGSLRGLKVNPQADVMYYKKDRPKLDEIAADLKCRYIVEGAVQKAGDRVRIKVSLTDAKEHRQLWSERYDGSFDDIFDLQDKTCFAITEALKLKLTLEDRKKIDKKPTENAEAYELYLKGREYFERQTRPDFDRALGLYEEAIRLDPQFALAHINIAAVALGNYRKYSRDPKWIAKAEEHALQAEFILGESARVYWSRSYIARNLGNLEEALQFAEMAVELDPELDSAYEILASAYLILGRLEEAAGAQERYLELNENDLGAHFNYLIVLSELGDISRLEKAARKAIPVYERHIRFTPDDLNSQVRFASILSMAGDHVRAIAQARTLNENSGIDTQALYNLACLFIHEADIETGLSVLQRSVAEGHSDIESFRRDPDLDPLRELPEFKALMKELEEKVARE